MGLNSTFIRDLLELKRNGHLDGFSSVIEVGAQQLTNDLLRDEVLISEAFDAFGAKRIPLGSPIDAGTSGGLELLHNDNPSSRVLWRALGFSYASIEFDGHRDSTPLDLNKARVPFRMRSKFDLVVNTGTTEHIANQDNAFRVIHDLCSPRGLMLHQVPAGGMMTHGLITYTPKFFWLLCRENDYQPLVLRTAGHPSNPVPKDIRDSNIQFNNGVDAIPDGVAVHDFTEIAALRKTNQHSFVTPLDVPPEIKPKPRRRMRDYLRTLRDYLRTKRR